MRRIFEWIGGFALIAFSFYFTDRVSLLVARKSELYSEIEAVSSIYETEPVDAVIDVKSNTIIPGKFGKVVNSEESYLEMHDFGSFNENYLVFDYIKPDTSLLDHKDKFITSGNPEKRVMSIILESDTEVEDYLDKQEVNYNKIVEEYVDTIDHIEIVNGAQTKEKFNTFNSKLEDDKKICVKDISNIELCLKHKYFLIDSKNKLTNSNIVDIKKSVASGAIILITSDAKLEDVQVLLNEIEFKDIKLVHISELISEKESQ